MRRKGFTVNYLTRLIIILVLIAAVLSMGGPAGQQIDEGLRDEHAQTDKQRLYGPFIYLAGAGSASMEIQLENEEYTDIAIDGRELRLEADFLDSSERAYLPSQYSYSTDIGEGEQRMCIEKQGADYELYSGSCEDLSCTSGCSTIESDGKLHEGYYCKDGAFTRKEFYENYYSSSASGCNQRSDFVAVDRVMCPDSAASSANYGCMMEFSWHCSGGSVTAELSAGSSQTTRSYDCTGEVEHNRIYVTLSGYSGSVSGSIDGPSGSDSGSESISGSGAPSGPPDYPNVGSP